MNNYRFQERLEWSKGRLGETDIDTIRNVLSGCVCVEEAPVDIDKLGIDYIATLRLGSKIHLDVKRRERGVSRYWDGEPELTLEQWSVCPSGSLRGVVGWTLDESKATDYVLYTFDPSDCGTAYLIPFQLLRMAYLHNNGAWRQRYKIGRCTTDGRYETESVFVPCSKVLEAVSAEMRLHDTRRKTEQYRRE